MTETVTKETVKPARVTLNVSRFKQAEYERTVYIVTPEYGVEFDQLRQPSYWAHVGAQLRPWDRIEVRPESGTYFAELLVVDCDRLWAKVAVVRYVDLTAEEAVDTETPAEAFEVSWGGPVHKFRVIRKADNTELRSGFQKKEDANHWLRDYRKAVGV